MIEIILCCHGNMAEGIRSAAELIIGPQEHFTTISVQPGDGLEDVRRSLKKALQNAGEDGAVILTDIPGGTPCNVAAMFVSERIRMITGFNLPLLIKLTLGRMIEKDVLKLTANAPEYAAEHVMDASFMLKGTQPH